MSLCVQCVCMYVCALCKPTTQHKHCLISALTKSDEPLWKPLCYLSDNTPAEHGALTKGLTACVCCPPCTCLFVAITVCVYLSTIDDTGCPTSQSVSPSKTPSGSDQSAHGSPMLPERKPKVKRVRVMAEWSGEPRSTQRHKRELRSAMKARGKIQRWWWKEGIYKQKEGQQHLKSLLSWSNPPL